MPIYEYQCSGCDEVHEMWQKITETPVVECPTCKEPMERLISASAFHLKGTGWYATDYKGSASSSKDAAKDSAKDPAKEGSKNPTETASNSEKSPSPNKSTAPKKDPKSS